MPKLPLWNVLDNGMSSRGKRIELEPDRAAMP